MNRRIVAACAGFLLSLLTACGGGSGSTSQRVTIEVGNASTGVFYLVSDNLDPSSWKDDASSHKVAGLPDGSAKVCAYTTSQGVTYQVWTTGAADSTDLARAECQRMGQ